MGKPKIEYINESTIFSINIPVLVCHLNYGNHLGYDSILSIIQEARMQWLKTKHMSEISIQNSIGYLVTDAALTYKSEAFHGDILNINMYIENLRRKSFDIIYKIIKQKDNSTVSLAYTSHIFYDFSLKKVAPAPKVFLEYINSNALRKSIPAEL